MDKVANVSPRRRRVRCPSCEELLSEPGSPIYECPFCSTLLLAKGIPADFQGDLMQMPVNENDQGRQKSQDENGLVNMSFEVSEQIRSQSQDQLNDHETNEQVLMDGNIGHQHQKQVLSEVVSVVENRSELELQLENDVGNGSTSVGDIDMPDYASKISTAIGVEGVAVDFRGKEGASASGCSKSQEETCLLLDNTIFQVPSVEDADYIGMPSASEKMKEFVGECECDPAGEVNDQSSQSEIIRDIDNELSFKYISSKVLGTNDKRTSRSSKKSSEASVGLSEMSTEPLDAHLSESGPFSTDENSDDYESYSFASEAASHASLDSEFDFPSPSLAESMEPNLPDLPFQQNLPLPDVHCDAPEPPHQLEWQYIDHENEELALQNSNGAKASSVGVDAKTASDEQNGDRVERAAVEDHACKEDLIKDESFSVGPKDTLAIVRESLHVHSNESDIAEKEEDSNCYKGSYQVDRHKSLLNNDLWEGVSESLDVLPSDAEHPFGRTTKGSTVIIDTELPSLSLSNGSKLETCSTTQENIQLICSVANVKLEDSVATIARENVVITGRESQSKIAAEMSCVENFQERSSDPHHSRQNLLLPDANNQSRGASTSTDVTTKRADGSAYLAQNKEPKSLGLQSFPFVTEQSISSSHVATNNFVSELHQYSSEEILACNNEGTGNMFDSRLHHNNKRNCSAEKHMQSELSNKYTSQVQNNMYNSGHQMSRSRSRHEASNRKHQRHAHIANERADEQGPRLQKQNHQADMHGMNYSGPANNVHGFSPGSLQSFGSTYYSNGSGSFVQGAPHSSSVFQYQAPSHPWMIPVMPGLHYGCHSGAPVCMACVHCQYPHLPQLSMPPCGLCFNQPLPVAREQGHIDLCSWHQAHQIQASHQGASVFQCSPTSHSRQARGRKPKRYPPLPRGSMAPYIICKGCEEILEVPTDFPLSDTPTQKLRCGACYKVAKFFVLKDNQGTYNAARESTTTNDTSTSSSYAIPFTEHSGEPSVSNNVQIMDSSYHQGINLGLHPPYKQGSFDSQQQISAASKRRGSRPSSLDEVVQSTPCEVAAPDQDEFFFRSLSRYSEVDSSRILFNGLKVSPSATGAGNFNGSVVCNAIHFQAPVDEKEEGLDFGAPRMSDGESLDQRSPESRMRSPENKRHLQLLDQKRCTKGSLEDAACCTTENMEQQALDLKRKLIAQGKRPSSSLFALLNQESAKFEINMEERVSFDESRSVLWSTASSSPMHDDHTNERSNVGGSSNSQLYKLTSNRFVQKGSRYVAGVLKRSLKDFRRGSY